MNTFIQADFIKFKIEVKELIQYVCKLKTLTMNIQTYLSINILVLLGIEANIFMFSIPFDKTYNQEYYNVSTTEDSGVGSPSDHLICWTSCLGEAAV